MSDYKIIINKDNCILMKKDNKYKIKLSSGIKNQCNLFDIIKSNKLFDLLGLLNSDIINKIKFTSENNYIKIVLNSFNYDSDDELNDDINDEILYIALVYNYFQIDSSNLKIECVKNNYISNKINYKKIEIDNLFINFNLNNNVLNIKITFDYIGEKLPIYLENNIGLIIRKMFKNLIEYYK